MFKYEYIILALDEVSSLVCNYWMCTWEFQVWVSISLLTYGIQLTSWHPWCSKQQLPDARSIPPPAANSWLYKWRTHCLHTELHPGQACLIYLFSICYMQRKSHHLYLSFKVLWETTMNTLCKLEERTRTLSQFWNYLYVPLLPHSSASSLEVTTIFNFCVYFSYLKNSFSIYIYIYMHIHLEILYCFVFLVLCFTKMISYLM